MKKLLLISLMTLVVFSLIAAPVALLSANRGRVELQRGTRNVRFSTGEMLQNNDLIRTGNESYAAYKYVDGSSVVRVFANSVVRVRAATTNGALSKTVAVERGSVYSNVNRNTGSYRVETSTTVASVRGTGFLTSYDMNDVTKYTVVDGTVEVEVKETGEKTLVGEGKTAEIDGSGNMEVRDSTPEDLQAVEDAENQTNPEQGTRTMRIPVQNENGQIKYIEIQY